MGDLSGVWKLVPLGDNNTPVLPEFPVPVYVSLTTVTDVVLLAELEKSSYERFEPVRISATLYEGGQVQGVHTVGGGPITNAYVYADIANPSSPDTAHVVLAHAGNGVYRGQFSGDGAWRHIQLDRPGRGHSANLRRGVHAGKQTVVLRAACLPRCRDVCAEQHHARRRFLGDLRSILVNRDAATADPGVELFVGVEATINGIKPFGDPDDMYYDIKADRIAVSLGAQVVGDVFYNELTSDGSVSGTLTTPLELPVGGFPPFEQPDPAVSTADDFVVPNGGDLQLPLGVHGYVTLQPGSKLRLAPGSYSMMSLRLKSGSTLEYSGPTRVRILEGMAGDNGTAFVPDGTSAGAADIIFFIQGTDAQSDFAHSVDISPKSTIRASVLAPNGTILINQESIAEGAFMARDIVIGQSVQLSYASAFSGLTKPSVPGGKGNGTLAEENIPKTYVLLQNYPNPFNPTTQIKYGLPKASSVNLTIFNMLGQEVARLVDEVQPEGYYVVQWNGRNQSGNHRQQRHVRVSAPGGRFRPDPEDDVDQVSCLPKSSNTQSARPSA